jgi:hypothetical protein
MPRFDIGPAGEVEVHYQSWITVPGIGWATGTKKCMFFQYVFGSVHAGLWLASLNKMIASENCPHCTRIFKILNSIILDTEYFLASDMPQIRRPNQELTFQMLQTADFVLGMTARSHIKKKERTCVAFWPAGCSSLGQHDHIFRRRNILAWVNYLEDCSR